MRVQLGDDAPAIQAREPHLNEIPIIETGRNFALETLHAYKDRTHALLDAASRRYPRSTLAALDKVSRAWLARWNNRHLPEIDEIARILGRPGAYFFSVNYEWACTCRAAPSPDGRSARLVRVLDWKAPGLGANLICAKVSGVDAGPFSLLTWPGYTGVLQVMAPGRFSAAINQPPMRKATGLFYLDWAANRRRVWHMPHPTPAHLLRKVAEEAKDFAEARRMLIEQPISTPAIFTLAGLDTAETAVIERTEQEARTRDGAQVAANHWETPDWHGHARGDQSSDRACIMRDVETSFDTEFRWLTPPILNDNTRLALVADAKEGRMIARGYEKTGPATTTLDMTWHPSA
ncbi:MAG: hypothetical protein WC026_14855 [Hyphomicrobium sp.]|uniref:hypothetical protein n=1 Tax=Hyphomicrobium sp. TaxID=82 RepID=UPI003569CDF8